MTAGSQRCNRVGLMYRGRLIRCEPPAQLKTGIRELCFEVIAPDLRATRAALEKQPGVVSVAGSGPALHLFLDPQTTDVTRLKEAVPDSDFRQIVPSLEDVFIAEVRKQEAARAA